jgi:hypothetical protein
MRCSVSIRDVILWRELRLQRRPCRDLTRYAMYGDRRWYSSLRQFINFLQPF